MQRRTASTGQTATPPATPADVTQTPLVIDSTAASPAAEAAQPLIDAVQALSGVPHFGELRELGLGSYSTPVGMYLHQDETMNIGLCLVSFHQFSSSSPVDRPYPEHCRVAQRTNKHALVYWHPWNNAGKELARVFLAIELGVSRSSRFSCHPRHATSFCARLSCPSF